MTLQTKSILFTQSQSLPQALVEKLSSSLPTVNIVHVPFVELTTLEYVAIPNFENYDVLLFVSKQAAISVSHLTDPIDLANCQFVSLGEQTGEYVSELFKRDCLVLSQFESAEHFFKSDYFKRTSSKRWLVPISLQSKGKYRRLATFVAPPLQLDEWVVYQNALSHKQQARICQAFQQLPTNSSIVFASSSAWQHLVASVGLTNVQQAIEHKKLQVFSIGIVTTKAIQADVSLVIRQANTQSMGSLIEKIEEVFVP